MKTHKYVEVNGGWIIRNKDNVIVSPQRHTLALYQAMYKSYKNHVGERTESGSIITEKMLEGIKHRMLELMGKVEGL